MVLILAALAAVSSIAFAAPIDLEARQSCGSGFYIISARGSTQAAGYGTTADIVNGIIARVPGSSGVAVNYPASIVSPPYPDSVTDGIKDTKAKIQSRVALCGASTRIVLVGFSQGANVMSDVLAGGVAKPAPIATNLKQYIKAVVLLADPAHAAGQTYNVGTGSGDDGIFARRDDGDSLALLNTYSSVIQDYCTADDTFCASGSSASVHSATPATYGQQAINFVASKA